MANNQAQDDDILTLLRLLSRRHDKYSKGLQVQGQLTSSNKLLYHMQT